MNGSQLANHLNTSYRHIDYWTRVGYLTAHRPTGTGSGNLREYHRDQIIHAWLMVELTGAGLTPAAAHDLATDLRWDLDNGCDYEHLGTFTISWEQLICGLCGDWLGPDGLDGVHDECLDQADTDLISSGYLRGRRVDDVPDEQRRFS